jgi:probable phosphoglycerate mutase
MATKVYLIRHGENVSAFDGRYYGQTDLPLSDRGRGQMAFLGEKLSPKPPVRLYCSDLTRSKDSAQVLAERWGISPIACQDLREINMGLWEGLNFEEIKLLYPDQAARWGAGSPHFRFPGGESLYDLRGRTLSAYQKLLAEDPNAIVVLVGHAGPNRVILCHALGLPLNRFWHLGQDYGSLSTIDYHGDFALLSTLNFREGMPSG